MRLADLDFELPPELVAQHPASIRDACRLLCVTRSGNLEDHVFRELPELLQPGDTLVRNISRVLPARLTLRRAGGRHAEVLLLEPAAPNRWWALARPARRLRPGDVWQLADGSEVAVDAVGEAGRRLLDFGTADVHHTLARLGRMPLPPYIRREAEPADNADYQTVYASVDGSVAAPTAGLHFTKKLEDDIRARGIDIEDLVLHVGPATFEPIRCDDPRQHVMHWERFTVECALLDRLQARRRDGRRVVAVGTTVCRTLESLALWQAGKTGQVEVDAAAPGSAALHGRTRLFIHAPYRFRVVDALVTNFHLPRSTLLLLVDAFAGQVWRAAYAHAVAARYRFFSYGDAMLLE